MARKNDGACANAKQIKTDVDCRNARPKSDKGVWSPAKISDATGGGLYLFVTPDKNRAGDAASKLWRMGYRFHARQNLLHRPLRHRQGWPRSRSPMRVASATRPRTCSRRARTQVPKSSSTSRGKRL